MTSRPGSGRRPEPGALNLPAMTSSTALLRSTAAALAQCGGHIFAAPRRVNTPGGPNPVRQPRGNAAIVGRPERDIQTSGIR
jgi:hypothetical protein